jgi:aminoglycoside phosphotransferase (APT) family kinase protein
MGRDWTLNLRNTQKCHAFLKKNIVKIHNPDDIIAAVRHWPVENSFSENELKFIHGNLRLDNVIRVKKCVCFIDFENCGIGSPYEDISRIFFQLTLMNILPMLPAGRALKFLSAFLEGYRAVRHLDME